MMMLIKRWSLTKDNHHRGQKIDNKQNHLCEQRDDDDKQQDQMA